jgi:hypothetical protein
MPYDPTLALRAVQPQIDFGGAVQNAMAFRNAQQVNQLNQLKLAQEQQAMQQETGLRNYLAQSPDLSAPETQRQLIGQYGAAGMDVVNKELQRRKFQEEVDKAGRENVSEALSNARDMYAGVLARHADNLNSEEALKDYLEVSRTAHNNEFLGPALKTTGASLANTYAKAQTALENGTLGDLIQSSAMSADQIRESIKAKAEAAAPKTTLAKLQSDYDAAVKRGDKVAAASIKKAIDIEAGGMTEAQKRSAAQEDKRIALLQDKANKGDTATDSGKELLTSQVISLRDTYDALSEKGGIVDTKAPWYKNLGAWVSSTGPGQTVGKALGTDTQSLRNTIAQSRPLLLNAIKQATGMTAKQMDSNVELQMYLRAATDPTADIQSNRKALQKLNDLFGLGIDLGPIESSATPAPASGTAQTAPKIGDVVKGYKFKGGDPANQNSWEKVK